MTTAVPLLAPFTLPQSRPLPAQPHRQRELCDEWGLAAAFPHPTSASPSSVTSILCWNDVDIASSASRLAIPLANLADEMIPAQPQVDSSYIETASLDRWSASVSFAPFSSSALPPLSSSPEHLDLSQLSLASNPKLLGQGVGRIVAAGLDDGTVLLYRAPLGQSSITSDSAASVHLSPSGSSPSPSPKSSVHFDGFRATFQESHGRGPNNVTSPSLSAEYYFGSSIGRSTLSLTSAGPTLSANVQIEEPTPAQSVETNVNVQGQSIRSSSNNNNNHRNDAEHVLEQQIAAAERSNSQHHHSMVGGVMEALGLTPTHSRIKKPAVSQDGLPLPGLHSPSFTPARSHTAKEPRLLSIPSQPGPRSHLASSASSERQPDRDFVPSSTSDAQLRSSVMSGAASHYDRYRPLLRIADLDRSAIVALRLLPPNRSTRSKCPNLLVVHQDGLVSCWSLNDSVLAWQTNLALRQPPACDNVDEKAGKQHDSSVWGLSSVAPLLRTTSSSFPASKSLAGSTNVTSKSATLSKAPFASQSHSLQAKSHLSEVMAVQLASHVQVARSNQCDLAAIWDRKSCSLFLVNLDNGALMATHEFDDILPSCLPSLQSNLDTMVITWFNSSGKLQTRSLMDLAPASASTSVSPASSADPTANQSANPDSFQAVPELHDFKQLYIVPGYLFGLDSCGLKCWRLTGKQLDSLSYCQLQQPEKLLDVQVENGTAMVQLASGLALVDWVGSKPPQVFHSSFLSDVLVKVPNIAHRDNFEILYCSLDAGRLGSEPDLTLTLWDPREGMTETVSRSHQPTSGENTNQQDTAITAILPLGLERVVVALSSGHLQMIPLSSLTNGKPIMPSAASSVGEGKEIVLLRQAVNPRSGIKVIIGGTRQGDVVFWDAASLELQALWSLSTAPVHAIVVFGDQDNTLRLHGCIACVSADSSLSIILLDGLKLLHFIPGRDANLQAVSVRADELLLTYEDGKARVWDMRSHELRRSIAIDQAQALVEDGKGWWSVRAIQPYCPRESGTSGVLSQIGSCRGTIAASLLVDFRRAIDVASRSVMPAKSAYTTLRNEPAVDEVVQQNRDMQPPEPKAIDMDSPAAQKAINIVRPLLAVVLPVGITAEVDQMVAKILQVNPTDLPKRALMSLYGTQDSLIVPLDCSADGLWSLSSRLCTLRSLTCSAMLGILTHVKELQAAATRLIKVIADELPRLVGPEFKELSLATLASFLLDSNEEIQAVAKQLFRASLVRHDDAEIEAICDSWQPLLPCNQPPVMSPDSPLALTLLGHIAVDRYKTLTPKLLKEISTSLSIMMMDETQPTHQAIAIDLCRWGFSIWQHYLDATEIVRSLFSLSTNKESKAAAENRTLARQATLHIASENTPLFMTTLSLDILHARSPSHCSATMRLVAYMVRKKPLVLYPNLPRLAEAVVKSLDPTITAMREAVMQAATVMISELVGTYPSIAFHGKLQRLAVGTHEGAVIMYDLKTATRLYVIEGHRRQLSGCSFSPDGRRLLTVSLEERKLLIWKVGSSLSSIFSPGTLPRQGGTDASGAYRAIEFNVGDAGDALQLEDMLSMVSFDWANDRSVGVKIGQAQVSLSVD